MRKILHRNWLTLGAEHGVRGGSGAETVVDDLVARTPDVVRTVRAPLPAGFPMHAANISLDGQQAAADMLAG
ncbi:hypothetical protein RAS12_30210 (plasmid) [Achromobacter seleniivolatilans]|uniref:Uncharacterized protein n=1 Tax=Achromobacter seleniivolatilans TaxID=3047478 RepID=A0ABY9MCK0_9BURK|nr:hypothetical protein [Achromobacter sp. R39]WMD23908.1 hypothetical protein RAS12_30210 [Achromobacter sp. R39]